MTLSALHWRCKKQKRITTSTASVCFPAVSAHPCKLRVLSSHLCRVAANVCGRWMCFCASIRIAFSCGFENKVEFWELVFIFFFYFFFSKWVCRNLRKCGKSLLVCTPCPQKHGRLCPLLSCVEWDTHHQSGALLLWLDQSATSKREMGGSYGPGLSCPNNRKHWLPIDSRYQKCPKATSGIAIYMLFYIYILLLSFILHSIHPSLTSPLLLGAQPRQEVIHFPTAGYERRAAVLLSCHGCQSLVNIKP